MFLIKQGYSACIAVDHNTWALLFKRQTRLVVKRASIEFKRGVDKLILNTERVSVLEETNHKSKQHSD